MDIAMPPGRFMRRSLLLAVALPAATLLTVAHTCAQAQAPAAKQSSIPQSGDPSGIASVATVGRVVTITLPFDPAKGLLWASATRLSEALPFAFSGLQVAPKSAPDGQSLAIFRYAADRPGSAVLAFGLVPPGKILVGPPAMIYHGPVAKRVSIRVSVQ